MIKKIQDHEISYMTWEGTDDDPTSDNYGMIVTTDKGIRVLADKLNEIIDVLNEITEGKSKT